MNNYKYKILDFSNYDGDSFDLTLDLGFELITHKKVRINGVDTPELRGGTVLSKALAKEAKEAAAAWVSLSMENGGAYFSSEGYKGKFGRPLGDIINVNAKSLKQFLLNECLAVPYHGQAKASIAAEHEELIKHHLEMGTINEHTEK